jgi:indolepyruvate ferredoxin oxidoreductase beta subunit
VTGTRSNPQTRCAVASPAAASHAAPALPSVPRGVELVLPTRPAAQLRPWSALVCGLPDDRTMLIVDWLLLACRSAGFVAHAVPVAGDARTPHGVYVEVAADADGELALGAVTWGAVDLVVAGEHLELMRAIDGGFVSREVTTIVASCRRSFTDAERSVAPQYVLTEREIDALAAASSRSYHAFDGPEVARWYHLPPTAQPGLLFGAICGAAITGLDETVCREAIAQLGIDAPLHGAAFGRGIRLGRRAGGRIRRTRTAYQFTRRRRAHIAHASRASFEQLVAHAAELVAPQHLPALQEAIYLLSDFEDADWAGRLVEHVAEFARLERDAQGGIEVDPDQSIMLDVIRSLAALMVWPDAAWVAQRKRRHGRHKDVRATQGITRSDAYELVDHIPLDARDLAASKSSRLPGSASQPPTLPPLLQHVVVRQIRTTTLGGAWAIRRMVASKKLRAGSPRQQLELETVEAWRVALVETLRADHEIARIVAVSGTLVQGSGAVREANRQTAQAFWGRIVRQSIALDRADPAGAAPITRELVPFVWEQLSRSGPLALWEFAAQVLGIAMACARGLPHEQAVAMAHTLCMPRGISGLGET